MAQNNNGWTWSPPHNDYYRAVMQPNGQWKYEFAKDIKSAPAAGAASSSPTNGSWKTPGYSYGYNNTVSQPVQATYTGQSAYQMSGAQSVSDVLSFNDAHTTFQETPGNFEALDASYKKVPANQEWEFWKPGTVFKALWWEADGGQEDPDPEDPSEVKYGETAFAKVYRFIVVRANPKEHWSGCLRISTYGGQATTKKGLDQKNHTIAYTGQQPPPRLVGEKKMNKDAIRVMPVNQSEKLDELSRLNLAKTYSIEHRVKVKKVGMVPQSDFKKMKEYWKMCNQ